MRVEFADKLQVLRRDTDEGGHAEPLNLLHHRQPKFRLLLDGGAGGELDAVQAGSAAMRGRWRTASGPSR